MFALNLRHLKAHLLFLMFWLIKVDIVAFGIGHVGLLSFGFILRGGTERVKLLVLLGLISIQGFLLRFGWVLG